MAPHRRPKVVKRKSHTSLYFAVGIIVIVLIVVGAYVAIGQFGSQNVPTPTPTPTVTPTTSPSSADSEYENATKVLLHTSMGDITIALRNDMPITTGNFINLVKQGVYNGTIFHRVIADFMIQGGDPTGTGYGDPSIPTIQDEFTSNNYNYNGTIAMANTGYPNTGSSQFFINVKYNSHLDTKHPVFGKVISGMDVVMAISKVQTDSADKPLQDVTLISATILP